MERDGTKRSYLFWWNVQFLVKCLQNIHKMLRTPLTKSVQACIMHGSNGGIGNCLGKEVGTGWMKWPGKWCWISCWRPIPINMISVPHWMRKDGIIRQPRCFICAMKIMSSWSGRLYMRSNSLNMSIFIWQIIWMALRQKNCWTILIK